MYVCMCIYIFICVCMYNTSGLQDSSGMARPHAVILHLGAFTAEDPKLQSLSASEPQFQKLH